MKQIISYLKTTIKIIKIEIKKAIQHEYGYMNINTDYIQTYKL